MQDTKKPSTRIEANRSRRSERTSENRRTRRNPVSTSTPSHKVPVMVRGEVMGLPHVERKSSKPRRRLDIALNIPGAELRLPAFPQIQFGWRFVSGFLALVLGVLLYYAWNAPFLQVQEIKIDGLQRLSQKDVSSRLDILGKPIFYANPQKMKESIEVSFPEFTKVSVEVKLPNFVLVSVEERTPILVWRQDDKSVLVDANGYAFPIRGDGGNEPALVVEASGPPPSVIPSDTLALQMMPFLTVEMVSGIVSMSAVAPSNTPILYSREHGLGWKDKKGWEVYFGDVYQIDMKLNVYKALVKKIKQEKLEPVLISVEFVRAPYYRLEQ